MWWGLYHGSAKFTQHHRSRFRLSYFWLLGWPLGSQMVPNCSQMALNGSQMVPNGFPNGSQIQRNNWELHFSSFWSDLRWPLGSQMAPNWSPNFFKWFQMASNGSHWSLILAHRETYETRVCFRRFFWYSIGARFRVEALFFTSNGSQIQRHS